MSEERPWVITGYINHINIVCIDINRFITDNELFQLLPWVPHDSDVSICNIELVLILQKELVLLRIFFIELDQEDTKLLFELVREEIEELGLLVIDDLLDV